MFTRPGLALLTLALAACNGGEGTGSDAAAPDGGGTCNVALATPASEGAQHVALCSAITYASNPPASGDHYQVWPVFRVYDQPVPWGYLVHGLEHGVVVIAYNCPDGCAQEVADARAMIATLPAKTGCTGPAVIMTPDPTLTTRWAASAWLQTLRASCFDKDAFAAFANAYMNMGPERIPGDCGAVDREAAGWCPTAP